MKYFPFKIRSVLIVLAFIIAVAVIAGSVYLDSTAFRNRVLAEVNAALDGRLIVGGHRLMLVSGRLVLNGVRLETAGGRPLAEAGRLEVRIDLWALLHRKIHVSALALDKVRVVLAYDDRDRLLMVGPVAGTPDTRKAEPSAGPWQVIIDDVRLREGELDFQRPARGWDGQVENIQLSAALDVGRQQGQAKISAGPLVWSAGDVSRTMPTLTATARYDGGRLSTITVKTPQSGLEARGRLIFEGTVPKLDVSADLDLALAEVRPWIPADMRLEGRAAIEISAHGSLDDPDAEVHLTLPQGNLAGIAVAPLTADLKLRQGKISMTELAARGRWGTLKADGVVDPVNGRIEKSSATLTSGNLAELGAALAVAMPSGSGSLKLNAEGPWARPTGRVEILASDLKWGSYTFGRLLAGVDLDASGVVSFSQLVLENQGSLVEGRGRVILQQADGQWRSDPGLDLTLDVENLDPINFGLNLPVKGRINAALDVGNTMRHLKGKAVLADSALNWQDLTFGLDGEASWDEGLLTVSDLRITRNEAAVRLQGDLRLRDAVSGQWLGAPVIQAQLQSQGMQLQEFWPAYSGAVTLEARIKGVPADLSGGFQLSGSDLELAGQSLAAAVIKGRLADKIVHLDTLELTLDGDQKVRGRGWYGFDQRFELSLDSAGIDLGLIPALQRAYPVEGMLGLSVEGRGTLQKPQVTADLTVRKPILQGQPWADFHLRAGLRERELDLDADLNFKLKGRGRLDNGDFQVTAAMDDADLSPYLAMAGGAQWGGRFTGRLEAAGNWHRPGAIRADLDISGAHLRYQDVDLLSIRRLQARLRDGRLDLPASRLELMQDGFVNLSGAGDLNRGLSLAADGRLPLNALEPFSDLLTGAGGALVFQARVEGPVDGLKWWANADLADVALEIPGMNQEVRELNGRIRLDAREFVVEQVTGRIDSGRFSLDGRMDLKDFQLSSGRLALNARSLPLQWPDTMDALVNGDLTLEAANGKTALSGRLVLLEGTYYKDVRLNLLSVVGQPRRAEPVPDAYELPAGLADIALNVTFTHRYPLLVDNNLARMQVAPDLKMTGTLGRPVISGRAQVTEGEVIFRSKSFTIKRGVVDFINPYKIEPTLDIAAESQVRQWLVSLSLSGTPDRLAFKLSSEPSMSESDILSLILLGRTSEELAGGQGGGQTTRQMLAALVASAWGEDVKKTTGVDILEVETGTGTGTTSESEDTIQLTVGKRLSRRLTIKYEVESGSQETIQRAVSEYRFLEHVLASGFQDSLGGYGGELLFRIEF